MTKNNWINQLKNKHEEYENLNDNVENELDIIAKKFLDKTGFNTSFSTITEGKYWVFIIENRSVDIAAKELLNTDKSLKQTLIDIILKSYD